MRQAAALPLVTITAWEGLIDRAKVHSGQTVLVQSGTGGVGYAAVQLAIASGAKSLRNGLRRQAADRRGTGLQTAIDRHASVADYVRSSLGGDGFDVVYDTLGGPVLDASFAAVKRYTGHVVSCLGWGSHLLAPLSFRGATYSGVFTLYPLLSGMQRAHHGHILAEAAKLAEQHQLKPLLTTHQFGPDNIAAAYDLVAKGGTGKVVVEL